MSTDIANTVHRHEQLLQDIHHRVVGHEEKFDGASSKFLIKQSASRILPTIADDHDQDLESLSGPIEQTEVRNEHNEQRFQHLEQVFSTITRGSHVDIRENQHRSDLYRSQRCEYSCRCRCHRRQPWQRDIRLMAFTNSLGGFSFSFGYPFGEECSTSTCISKQTKWVRATYTFPVWLLQATISLFKDWAVAPEPILRVHRRVASKGDTLFLFVARGDIDNVKRLLLRKEAAVTDMRAVGGESILHTAFNLRHRAEGLALIQLLVQEGADWCQEKDNGHMPCEFTPVQHVTWLRVMKEQLVPSAAP